MHYISSRKPPHDPPVEWAEGSSFASGGMRFGNKRGPRFSKKNRFLIYFYSEKFVIPSIIKYPNMKNKNSSHHEEAKIYRDYYKPHHQYFRLVKSVLSVFISARLLQQHGYDHNRKMPH
jgi:hypothetical protein